MNVSELKNIISRAKICQQHRSDPTLASALEVEIEKLENKIIESFGKDYTKLKDEIIPQDIEEAADYLTSCHGLGRYDRVMSRFFSLLEKLVGLITNSL